MLVNSLLSPFSVSTNFSISSFELIAFFLLNLKYKNNPTAMIITAAIGIAIAKTNVVELSGLSVSGDGCGSVLSEVSSVWISDESSSVSSVGGISFPWCSNSIG